MKTYEFHYSIHEVDGKEVELIECTTWPRLDVQVSCCKFDIKKYLLKALPFVKYSVSLPTSYKRIIS